MPESDSTSIISPGASEGKSLFNQLRKPSSLGQKIQKEDFTEPPKNLFDKLRAPQKTLEGENRRLQEENKRLREENARLQSQVTTPALTPQEDPALPSFLQRTIEARAQVVPAAIPSVEDIDEMARQRIERATERQAEIRAQTEAVRESSLAGLLNDSEANKNILPSAAERAEPILEPTLAESEQQMAEKKRELEEYINSLESEFERFQISNSSYKLDDLKDKLSETQPESDLSGYQYQTKRRIADLIRESGLKPDDPVVQKIKSLLDNGYYYGNDYKQIEDLIPDSFGSRYAHTPLPWADKQAEKVWKAHIKRQLEERRQGYIPENTERLAEILRNISEYKDTHGGTEKVSLDKMQRSLNPPEAYFKKPEEILFYTPTDRYINGISSLISNLRLDLNNSTVSQLRELISEGDWEKIQVEVFRNLIDNIPAELGLTEDEIKLVEEWYESLQPEEKDRFSYPISSYSINEFFKRGGTAPILPTTIPSERSEETEWTRFRRALSVEDSSSDLPPTAEPVQDLDESRQPFKDVFRISSDILGEDQTQSPPLVTQPPREDEREWSRFARALSRREASTPPPFKVEITNPENLEQQVNQALSSAPTGLVEFEMSPTLLRSVLETIPQIKSKLRRLEVSVRDDPKSPNKILVLKGDLGVGVGFIGLGGVTFDSLMIAGQGDTIRVLNRENLKYYGQGSKKKDEIEDLLNHLDVDIFIELQKRITVPDSRVEGFTIRGDKLVLEVEKR